MEYRKRRIIFQNLKSKGFIEERDRDHIVLKFLIMVSTLEFEPS